MNNHNSYDIYVAVDPTKIARCKWCGTLESQAWTASDSGVYCSSECRKASEADVILIVFFIWLTAVPIQYNILRMPPFSSFILEWLFSIALGSPLLVIGLIGYRAQKSVPKDSRRDAVPLSIALLKTLSYTVTCPRCDANIDLRKTSNGRIFKCDYCGATGTIKIARTDMR